MRRLGGEDGVAPVQHPLLLEPAATRTSCSMVQNSKYYSATGQRGADGKRAVASATTSILHKAHNEKNTPMTQTLSIALSAPSRHTQVPSRPKDATWPRRHGKFFHFRHGREGLAAADSGLGEGWFPWRSWGNPTRCTQPRSSHLHRMLTRLGVCPHGPWLIAR